MTSVNNQNNQTTNIESVAFSLLLQNVCMQAPISVRRYGINDRFRVNKITIHSSHSDVLMQDCSNSIANALELLQ